MKRTTTVLITLVFLLAACTSTHEYIVKDNELFLRLKKPEAKLVQFASSLDGFKLHKAERIGGSAWQIVAPAEIEFTYFYVVDGFWYTPECKFKERDDFGRENCVYVPDM